MSPSRPQQQQQQQQQQHLSPRFHEPIQHLSPRFHEPLQLMQQALSPQSALQQDGNDGIYFT
jgi:hypothetical protein